MSNICIGRYPVPTESDRASVPEGVGFPADRWESYIEPEDRSWILFVGVDGDVAFWPHRDANGGVIGEPTTK
jgi:hypothetical protein